MEALRDCCYRAGDSLSLSRAGWAVRSRDFSLFNLMLPSPVVHGFTFAVTKQVTKNA